MHESFTPGERFQDMIEAREREEVPGPGIWSFLGWRLAELEPGHSVLEWDTTTDHCFPAGDQWIVHGGMLTALLDTAMGNSTWGLLNRNEVFLTADLRTEFYRPASPGLLRAEGRVIHKTRRVAYAAAEVFDAQGNLLAGGRATNLVMEPR